MTTAISGIELANQIKASFAEAVLEGDERAVILRSEYLTQVASFLKTTPGLEFDYLSHVTAVDYLDYFEVIYHITSLAHNHSAVIKVKTPDRDNPEVPSVASVWCGANLQEREVYDLMGVTFLEHPNLKRVLLWEGFPGHPLRKDFLTLEGKSPWQTIEPLEEGHHVL
ncbi:MAG: NADH-quinone oxidoreductase subunit C [Chloroflexi bacterium]|nr:NADH-quinone oxidoreductase subunit C [Chloroflexota bacterium]